MREPDIAGPSDENQPTWLDLYDWRLRVAALYADRAAAHRRGDDAAGVAARFRSARDDLFRLHPQSPLDRGDRVGFAGLPYFDYDPGFAVQALLSPAPAPDDDAALPASGEHAMRFLRAGYATFHLGNQPLRLIVYWIDVYGGGLFLPFRDMTSGKKSYGGGRYLFDTVKGSDFVRLDPSSQRAMGDGGGHLLLDFNYAYNPSCAYSPRWVCPLAPNENHLPVAVTAGERTFHA